MKKINLLIVLLLPIVSLAQTPKDSVDYYQKEKKKMWDEYYQRFTNSEQYKTMQQGLDRALTMSRNYSGLTVFGNIIHNDYTRFNNNIAQNGFGPLSAMAGGIGLGVSGKSGRLIFEYNFFILGFNNTAVANNEKISSSLSDLVQVNFGFDLFKSQSFSLYPFGGLGGRLSSLQYFKPPQTNAVYTNISNIVNIDQSVTSSSLRIGYQAGIGLDILALKTDKKKGAILLFAKFYTDGPLWTDKYKIDGIAYEPGFRQGDWVASFGLKFVSRQ
jgi:hypothetical protein